ncbi:hypothetical protein ONS95_001322 [Cadophora gregata]|uniref:uncharacterized protein n=1 Tax=Cadophora gregata TaxID=51156 RepID=UPI0026DBB010|nr:uncharacterized protein ONS95_001322 [Cadophora gregata]KAK0101867.1 hypothetical protein ONS96_005842 [Cadophora gregata f. sp. sojae]KAK0129396.1 hypothetical protein ONS95_001322 [Cadophora gregata]
MYSHSNYHGTIGPPAPSSNDLQDQIWKLQEESRGYLARIDNPEARIVEDRQYALELERVLNGMFSGWTMNPTGDQAGNQTGTGSWNQGGGWPKALGQVLGRLSRCEA